MRSEELNKSIHYLYFMYHAKHLSPMLPSLNIPKTVSFFTDFLDFKVIRDEKTYVILEKDLETT